jgi:hypothetical protein
MTDELDDMLQRASPYIDDGGFTDRVMQALPARRASRVPVLVVVSTAAGAGIVAFGPGRSLLEGLMAGNWYTLAVVAGGLLVLAGTAVSAVLREAEG